MGRARKRKKREAIALEYQPADEHAPRVVAKGKGAVAEKIIEVARKAGVPIREDSVLVSLLSHLRVDQEITPEAYKAVAELLAFIYRVHNRWKARAEVKMD
jgi:flagellar biosynthesis protein